MHVATYQSTAYVARLDHLRLLAAMLVFCFHYYHHFYGQWRARPDLWGFGWLVEGHTGVSLFFVLSGFIFMRIAMTAGGEIHYWGFLRNRLLRIFPLFLFVFAVALSVTRDAFAPQNLLYVFATNLGLAPTSFHFITGAAWSISVEFTFYLVFPFIGRFAFQQGAAYLLRLIFLLLIFKVAAFFIVERPTHMYFSTLLGRFDQFLIGMLAALVAPQVLDWLKRAGRVWSTFALFACAVLIFGAIEWQAHQASFYRPVAKQAAWILWPTIEAGLWAAFVLAYVGWAGRTPAALERVFEAGGRISYSFYLWHAVIIFIASALLPAAVGDRTFVAALFPVVLLVVWLVASLSYRTIEAPFLALRRPYHA
jgi:peptidoglycan/LPS O-acetylase OafA/YrhL